jgi:hypothetical protein
LVLLGWAGRASRHEIVLHVWATSTNTVYGETHVLQRWGSLEPRLDGHVAHSRGAAIGQLAVGHEVVLLGGLFLVLGIQEFDCGTAAEVLVVREDDELVHDAHGVGDLVRSPSARCVMML